MRAAPLLVLVLLLTPLAIASEPMMPTSTWTVFTSVDATIRDNFATVKITADIQNRGPDPEFPFVVRVPDDAFVTGLVIERDGVVHEAAIKDREAARAEYEAWKAQEQTGGLVEKTRRSSVYSYLINVAEFTSVKATLTYERYLVADRGVYELPLEAPVSGFGQDLGARFTVVVRDSDGVVALWGAPGGRLVDGALVHEVGPRAGVEHPTPFNASYTLQPTAEAGTLLTTIVDGKGYFAHRFRATPDARQLPMDLVLVLDVSGSMAGLKLQQMIDASKQVVAALDDKDRLHLVAFSSDARSTWSGLLEMTPENRKRAARDIDALFDGGGTNIEAGLRRGFDGLAGTPARTEGRFPAVVLLTDGQPTAGVSSRADLLALATRLNAQEVPVFTIAFGHDADWTLVRQLATSAGGAAILVPQGTGAEVDLRRFMAALTTPVLRDVRIDHGPGVTAHGTGAPVLFAGSELLVVGTFDPAQGIRGSVRGWQEGEERRYDFDGGSPADLPFLPRLVAYHEIRDLQQDEPTPANIARIKTLALAHGFVTDHTSLVLTLPPRDARPFTPGATDARSEADCVNCSSSPSMMRSGGGNAPATLSQYAMDATATSDPATSATSSPPAPSGTPTAPERAASDAAQVPLPGLAMLLAACAVAVALASARRGAR